MFLNAGSGIDAGNFTITTGGGGNQGGQAQPGSGGGIAYTLGKAGITKMSGLGTGGGFALTAGDGGDMGDDNVTGGPGGAVSFTAGDGGSDDAAETGTTGGAGGDVNWTVGQGGVGDSADGADGVFNWIGDETLVLDLSVSNTATFSTTSGITTIDFSAMALTTTGSGTFQTIQINPTGTGFVYGTDAFDALKVTIGAGDILQLNALANKDVVLATRADRSVRHEFVSDLDTAGHTGSFELDSVGNIVFRTNQADFFIDYFSDLFFRSGASGADTRFQLDVAGKLSTGGAAPVEHLDIFPDTDVSARIGRVHIGQVGSTDLAAVSHVDQAGITTYALIQTAAGKTIINGVSGEDIELRIGNATDATRSAYTATGLGIGLLAPTLPLDVRAKVGMTAIGGIAVKLTNKTGANSVAGQLVKSDVATNDAVVLTGATDDECVGVFLDAGIADGSEAWVVITGIVDMAFDDNVAAVRGNWVGTGAPGYARTQASPPALGIAAHFEEIGHSIESVGATGGGTHILARCLLQFN